MGSEHVRFWERIGRLLLGLLALLGVLGVRAFGVATLDLNSSAQYYKKAGPTPCNSARIGSTVDPQEEPILPICGLGCNACLEPGKCPRSETTRCSIARGMAEEESSSSGVTPPKNDGLLIMRATTEGPAGGILPGEVCEDCSVWIVETQAGQALDCNDSGCRVLMKVTHDGIEHDDHMQEESTTGEPAAPQGSAAVVPMPE